MFGDFGAATDLTQLSESNRQLIQAIEVRAFAYLVDDLLSLCDGDALHELLHEVIQQCLVNALAKRPKLSDLNGMLEAL